MRTGALPVRVMLPTVGAIVVRVVRTGTLLVSERLPAIGVSPILVVNTGALPVSDRLAADGVRVTLADAMTTGAFVERVRLPKEGVRTT